MMRICQINTVSYGSTGKIMLNISDVLHSNGDDSKTYSMKWRSNCRAFDRHKYFGFFVENYISIKLAEFTGMNGCFATIGTHLLIKEIKKFSPHIIHLHNLHNSYINLPMLFKFIKKSRIPVVWTLHDCWAFTGHCAYFTFAECDKWINGCFDCKQYKTYPKSRIDNSKKMYSLKKKWFCGVPNLTIVTPSEWLAKLVKKSYLKDYNVEVINNGINLDVFKPCKSDFRVKYRIFENQHIVLGVAMDWGHRKGLDTFVELYNRLPNDRYKIVLVGTNDDIDKDIPDGIISIHRTKNQIELAEIYSAADVFVNATREDNFPTVNIEALACGTPVLTFNVGGSAEMIDKSCGIAVQSDDVDSLSDSIIDVCEKHLFTEDACVKHGNIYKDICKFTEYISLYRRINDRVTEN